jgi:uncharacterized protein (TIGR03067 family)
MSVWLVAAAALLIAADDAKEAAVKQDREKMAGTWIGVSIEMDGNKLDDEAAENMSVTFDVEGKFTVKVDGDEFMTGNCKLDPTKDPKEVDYAWTQDGVQKRIVAIYKLDGDKLTVCGADEGDDSRPKEFASKSGSRQTQLTYKRDKRN